MLENIFRATPMSDGGDYRVQIGTAGSFSAQVLRTQFRIPLPVTIPELVYGEYHRFLKQIATTPDDFTLARTGPPEFDLPLYSSIPIVWGAGLNFSTHATDLDTQQPQGMPGSYCRPGCDPLGPAATISLPNLPITVTAEAEIGLVVGTRCKDVKAADAHEVIAGVTPLLDLTAESVIRQNPRYIPWAKCFDDFFAFGPEMALNCPELWNDLSDLSIETVHNGCTVAQGRVAEMMTPPAELVELFTTGRTLHPGTVIACGTPGAAVLAAGDTIAARITSFSNLELRVR